MKFVISFLLLLFLFSGSAIATETIDQMNYDVDSMQKQLRVLQRTQADNEATLAQAQARLTGLTADYQNANAHYIKALNEYNRATQNPDIVSDDTISALKSALLKAQSALTKASNDRADCQRNIDVLQSQLDSDKQQLFNTSKRISEKKAEIFDLQYKSPIWSDGYSDVTCDSTITESEGKKMARDYAVRDCIEHAGALFVNAVSVVDMNSLTEDKIKTSVQAQILKEDTSGGMGTPVESASGQNTRFVCHVRMLVQNTSSYNPYRRPGTNGPAASSSISGNAVANYNFSPDYDYYAPLSDDFVPYHPSTYAWLSLGWFYNGTDGISVGLGIGKKRIAGDFGIGFEFAVAMTQIAADVQNGTINNAPSPLPNPLVVNQANNNGGALIMKLPVIYSLNRDWDVFAGPALVLSKNYVITQDSIYGRCVQSTSNTANFTGTIGASYTNDYMRVGAYWDVGYGLGALIGIPVF